jgi:hypothetical protein
LATSPLFYSGAGINGNISWLWIHPKNETYTELSITSANTAAYMPLSNILQGYSGSTFMSGSIYLHTLFTVPFNYDDKLTIKAGGAITNTWNIRSNPSLFNNGFGMESFANLSLSTKGIYDVSRKNIVIKDYYFFTRTLFPAKRQIGFQLNIGLLNLNYRPGYAYNADIALDGTNTNPLAFLLDGHKWTINGYRLGTRLYWEQFTPNGNGHRWSYIWDIAQAPGRFEPFEMATHKIQYTLMFRNK